MWTSPTPKARLALFGMAGAFYGALGWNHLNPRALGGVAAAVALQVFQPKRGPFVHYDRKERRMVYGVLPLFLIIGGLWRGRSSLLTIGVACGYFSLVYVGIEKTRVCKMFSFSLRRPYNVLESDLIPLDEYLRGASRTMDEVFCQIQRFPKSNIIERYRKQHKLLQPCEEKKLLALENKLDSIEKGKNALFDIPSTNPKDHWHKNIEEITTYLFSFRIALFKGEKKPEDSQALLSQLESLFEAIFNKEDAEGKTKAKSHYSNGQIDNYNCGLIPTLVPIFEIEKYAKVNSHRGMIKKFYHEWIEIRRYYLLHQDEAFTKSLNLPSEEIKQLRMNCFHGTSFGALKVAHEKKDGDLVHYGRMKRLGIVPVSGALDPGSSFNGVNQDGISCVVPEQIPEAKRYAKVKSDNFDLAKLKNLIQSYKIDEKADFLTGEINAPFAELNKLAVAIKRVRILNPTWFNQNRDTILKNLQEFQKLYEAYKQTDPFLRRIPEDCDDQGIYGFMYPWDGKNDLYIQVIDTDIAFQEAIDAITHDLIHIERPMEDFGVLLASPNTVAMLINKREQLACHSLRLGEHIQAIYVDDPHKTALKDQLEKWGYTNIEVHPLSSIDAIHTKYKENVLPVVNNFFPSLNSTQKV
ncbi:MAG: hypothetical protein KDK71_02190 [Chlamydiia bacterium]|nr:hypothetical protein [Chlamydiia bacterium]